MVKTHRKKIESVIFVIILVISSSLFSGNTFNSTISFQPNDTVTVIKPENHYQIENQFITSILTRYHFKEFEIDDSLSNMIFNRYLEALDNGKNYFLASDIESFNAQQFQLDDNLYKGDIQYVHLLKEFNRYRIILTFQ